MSRRDTKLRLNVIHTIDREDLLNGVSGVLCCLSGGADSVTLLHVMLSLRQRYGISISAVHVNHGIRGNEADRDEMFCKELCSKYGIKLYVKRGDVPSYAKSKGISTELAAREVRYSLFEEALSESGAEVAATAHNANDNAETLLFNIIRGTSPTGICAIPYKRDRYIRPLICVTREQIMAYVAENELSYVIDSTNGDDDYTRNFIRHNIMPQCIRLNPSFVSAVTRLTDGAKADERLIASLGLDRKRNVVEFLETNGIHGVNHVMISKIATALQSGGSHDFILTAGRMICTENGTLLLRDDACETYNYSFARLREGQNAFFGGKVLIKSVLSRENFREIYKTLTTHGHLSAIITDNVVVRNRRAGDAVCVNGIHKSVKKELINRKIPRRMRDVIPVFCVDGKIAFVPFVGVDDDFSPHGDTSLKISVYFNLD